MTTFLENIVDIAQQLSVDMTSWDNFEAVKVRMNGLHIPIPRIVNLIEEEHEMSFDLVDCDVSIVNALRRTMLSDVPVCCIRSENETVNQCRILVNHTRLHNEILKQRLSAIPVHTTDLTLLPGKYQLVLDVTNDTDHVMVVTSEHFRLRQIDKELYMSDEVARRIFPACELTGDFVHFANLKPAQNTHVQQLHLVADFSVSSARNNAMFNAVSKCTYFATVDWDAARAALAGLVEGWRAEGLSDADVRLRSDNFMLLDAFRYVVKNSWRVSFASVGVAGNELLLKQSLRLLEDKLAGVFQGMGAAALEGSDGSSYGSDGSSYELRDFSHANLVAFMLHLIDPSEFVSVTQTHPHIPSVCLVTRSSFVRIAVLAAIAVVRGIKG